MESTLLQMGLYVAVFFSHIVMINLRLLKASSLLPRGDSWTLSWRRPRSETQCAPSCSPTRSPSWWPRVSRVRPWPLLWRCLRTPCRRSPDPAPGAWWSSPWPPPTRPGRTLTRHGWTAGQQHVQAPKCNRGVVEMFDILTLSCTEVLWVDGRVQDSVPQSVAVPVDTKASQ